MADQSSGGSLDPQVANLKTAVLVAREKFELAAAFHEAWKLMAHDVDLQARMGNPLRSR